MRFKEIMYVHEITEKAILCFQPNQKAAMAFAMMRTSNIKAAPIVDKGDNYLGTLVDTFDSPALPINEINTNLKVIDIPLSNYPTLHEDWKIGNLNYFTQGFLPVLDSNNKYKGILTALKLWLTFQSLCFQNVNYDFLEHITEPIMLFDTRNIKYANRKFVVSADYEKGELTGISLEKIISASDINKLKHENIAVISINGKRKKAKLVSCQHKGMELSAIVIMGDFLEYVKNCLDGDDNLAENHNWNLFDLSLDGFAIMDSSRRVVRVNKKMEKFCAMSNEEIKGIYVSDLIKQGIISTAISEKVMQANRTVTIKQRFKDNTNIFTTGVPIFDKDNVLEYVFATARDINAIKTSTAKEKKRPPKKISFSSDFYNLINSLEKEGFIFTSTKTKKIISDLVLNIAPTDETVLISGETGTGKEVIADIVYRNSRRNKKPFVKINCGAIPKDLIESELFGYERGAFTGAKEQGKPGLFETADQGTLLLDEIGELPVEAQVKLLRVIQNFEIVRVGGTKSKVINVRIIASTNRELKPMIEKGSFREDLYYRLNVFSITIPPLRDRTMAIPNLVNLYLNNFNKQFNKRVSCPPDIMTVFANYSWPGNIRELSNIIKKIVIMAKSNTIEFNSLPGFLYGNKEEFKDEEDSIETLKEAKERIERELILKAMKLHGSTYKAAKALEVSQSTVFRLLKKYMKGEGNTYLP